VAKETPKTKKNTTDSLFSGLPLHRIGPYLAILGTILYLQTVAFDYTQDDAIVINENMFTKQGISGIPGIFGHDTFFGYFKDENKLRLVAGGRYRPLTPAMFAIEYTFVGAKPWLSHFVNGLCYGMLCWILFGFARALMSQRMSAAGATQAALFTALIFAIHPIHTEAVANIKGRDEIVAAMGALLGLWLMIRSVDDKNPTPLRIGAAVAFLAGLLAKENVITLLAVAPVTLWWYKKSPAVKWVSMLWPIVISCVVFILIRGAVTGLSPGKPPMELMNNPFLKIENNNYVPFSAAEKSATIVYTMGKYVQLLFVPYPQTHDYYPRHIEIQNWSKPYVILSFLAWCFFLYLVIKGWKNRTWLAYGIIFYVCTMSIASNIIFPIGTNMSERFAFLPSVGFALIAGVGFSNLLNGNNKKIFKPVIIGVLALLTVMTIVRSRVWINNHILFTSDIHTSKRSAKLLNAVGGDLVTQSQTEKDPVKKMQMLKDAQSYLKQALEIHPNYKLSYLLIGNSAFYLKDYEQAVEMFRLVLKLDEDFQEGKRNLGVALRDWGKQQGEESHNLVGAISLLEEAVQYLPNDFETYHLLGVAYGQNGDSQKAIDFFKKEIELAPKSASGYFNLGIAYQHAGDEENAQKAFQQAKAIDPNLPQLKGK